MLRSFVIRLSQQEITSFQIRNDCI